MLCSSLQSTLLHTSSSPRSAPADRDTSGHMNGLTSDAIPLQLCNYILACINSHAGPLPCPALWSRSHRSSST